METLIELRRHCGPNVAPVVHPGFEDNLDARSAVRLGVAAGAHVKGGTRTRLGKA